MRLICTIFSILLLSFSANAQKLTGIWRGYFSSSNGSFRQGEKEEMYKYEIQIDQQSNNGVKGVTYSYKSTVFYGKAEVTGIFTATSKSLLLREIKLIDLKVAGQSDPCLMTCYLDYSKADKMEFLQGTFFSINAKDKSDCGNGKVYLEKVATSDFKKEEFLIKKGIDDTFKQPALTLSAPKKATPAPTPVEKPKQLVPPPVIVTKPSNQAIAKVAPHKLLLEPEKAKVPAPVPNRLPQESVNSTVKKDSAAIVKDEHPVRKVPVPKVLLERENNLVKTIITDEENIQIDFYDNGIIDNDTISVYHNNVLVASNGRLTYTPITIKIKCSKIDNIHEIIVVAENLGEIPPNTALMVITAGGRKRYEVFLASTEQRNAKVVIEYRPKQ